LLQKPEYNKRDYHWWWEEKAEINPKMWSSPRVVKGGLILPSMPHHFHPHDRMKLEPADMPPEEKKVEHSDATPARATVCSRAHVTTLSNKLGSNLRTRRIYMTNNIQPLKCLKTEHEDPLIQDSEMDTTTCGCSIK
jgi:hypothetical protein